jgi:multidrug efflux pump subunit AcrB
MAAFFTNHPIIAIVTLWVIGIIGFVCILQLPIR